MAFDRKKKVDPQHINPYLETPEKGLRLLASLLAPNRDDSRLHMENRLNTLIASCGRLDMSQNDDKFAKLKQILQLLRNPARAELLRGSTIVGFGGQFSSGKSSVLNSLLEGGSGYRLPESTSATTSIPTYLMHAPEEKVIACTRNGCKVDLDPHGLAAISHQFKQKHNINPAQYIDFIGVSLPQFAVSGVALLDTPGYNASDIATRQEDRDNMRSQDALRSVDHLVWLIYAKEPTLTKTDELFIKQLNVSGKITVLVNKCDQVEEIYNNPHPAGSGPIQRIRDDFARADIKCADIIPYCAREPEWADGRQKALAFLTKAARGANSAQERKAEMRTLLEEIGGEFTKVLGSKFVGDMKRIDDRINSIGNPMDVASLARVRGLMGFERSNLRHDREVFQACARDLLAWCA